MMGGYSVYLKKKAEISQKALPKPVNVEHAKQLCVFAYNGLDLRRWRLEDASGLWYFSLGGYSRVHMPWVSSHSLVYIHVFI
jgi:hypothetical protein